ncbi:MAG: LysM peptidoglycan-binding domain-containing protein [Bacteroidota bacterium]
MSSLSSGELEQLVITSYADEDYRSQLGEYTTLVNPGSFRQQYKVDFDTRQPIGASSADLRFKGIQSPVLDLQLLFDATGAIGGIKDPVVDQVEEFRQVAMGYEGDIHRTPYLKIAWGALLFKGVVLSINVNYVLFRPDGTPVRAVADCMFQQSVPEETRAKEENNNSPDMTHVREVREGDTLVGMTYGIYGDTKYYPQIAAINNLKSFRDLTPGDRLIFPPIDDTSA